MFAFTFPQSVGSVYRKRKHYIPEVMEHSPTMADDHFCWVLGEKQTVHHVRPVIEEPGAIEDRDQILLCTWGSAQEKFLLILLAFFFFLIYIYF